MQVNSTHASSNGVLWWCAFVICSCVFLAHFALVQLSNMPFNPISAQLNNVITLYTAPVFSQNWAFFAPQPVDADMTLVARAQYLNSARSAVTPWVDISNPLFAAVRDDRFTAMNLVELGVSNAILSYSNNLPKFPKNVVLRHGKKVVKGIVSYTSDPYYEEMLARAAAATLELAYPSHRFTRLQLTLIRHVYPRFTKRTRPDASIYQGRSVAITWQPFPSVTPYCCVTSTIVSSGVAQ